MTLQEMIASKDTPISEIGAWLDSLPHEERLEAVVGLGKAHQRSLFERADPAITLDHFVPPGVGPLVEVIHHGRNTLPAFKRFQKRFCRPAEGSGRLFGYNEGATRGLIGPGFFVTVPTRGNPAWEQRGAVVVDYFQVPDAPVVEGWPRVVPNTRGLQVFVYNKTRDFMRRVSNHVSIGAAYKEEKAIGAWFVLCREDVAG
ncbi:MAG: hypothetical protein AMXMBFR64_03340 [Myxococcales bacterium]